MNERGTSGSGGIDLRAIEDMAIPPGEQKSISVGYLGFEIPDGYVGLLRGRSGMALRRQVWAFEGTIDSDYKGEVQVILHNFSKQYAYVSKGERIAQIVVVPFTSPEGITILSSEPRDEKGFGSTDNIIPVTIIEENENV